MMTALILLALIGCGAESDPENTPEALDCSTDAWSSVHVDLVDEDGNAFSPEDGYLWYSIDGGEEREGTQTTTGWTAGIEETGEFALRGGVDFFAGDSSCSGYWMGETIESVTVELGADGCHVETVELELVIQTDCITDTLG